jgi:hypothetical protein
MATSVEREDMLEAATWLVEAEAAERLNNLYLGFPGQWGLHRREMARTMETLDLSSRARCVDSGARAPAGRRSPDIETS